MGGLVLGLVAGELGGEVTWGLIYRYDYINLHLIAWAGACEYTQNILV